MLNQTSSAHGLNLTSKCCYLGMLQPYVPSSPWGISLYR